MAKTADLAKSAAKILGIDIGVTDSGRAYYYAGETGQWLWLTAEDLRYAATVAEERSTDVYSHWCAGTSAREMSARSHRALGL